MGVSSRRANPLAVPSRYVLTLLWVCYSILTPVTQPLTAEQVAISELEGLFFAEAPVMAMLPLVQEFGLSPSEANGVMVKLLDTIRKNRFFSNKYTVRFSHACPAHAH